MLILFFNNLINFVCVCYCSRSLCDAGAGVVDVTHIDSVSYCSGKYLFLNEAHQKTQQQQQQPHKKRRRKTNE